MPESWEERMGARARAARARQRQAELDAYFEALAARDAVRDAHRSHGSHLHGTRVVCNCGRVSLGSVTAVILDDYDSDAVCTTCGRPYREP